jgi:hypothetical protein
MKMKSFILTAAIVLLTTVLRAADPPLLTVAVFDFDSHDENVRGTGPKLSALVSALLSTNANIETVERTDLATAMGEQEMGLSGTVGSDTAAKVGHLTGAKVLVTGRVFRTDNELTVVAKIIGTETSVTYGEIAQGPAAGNLTDLAGKVAVKVAKAISDKADMLVSKAETREQKIDRIVKALKEGKRPAVLIRLPETHFGLPVIDPAAQTELAYILDKAGFTVVDEKSDQKPDIEISGQAFSAYGMRKGNLVSCKSRVELKAQERVSGKILFQDSQTSVAVDIAEQTAAKTALQNAADEMAERLVPKLTQ